MPLKKHWFPRKTSFLVGNFILQLISGIIWRGEQKAAKNALERQVRFTSVEQNRAITLIPGLTTSSPFALNHVKTKSCWHYTIFVVPKLNVGSARNKKISHTLSAILAIGCTCRLSKMELLHLHIKFRYSCVFSAFRRIPRYPRFSPKAGLRFAWFRALFVEDLMWI